VTAFLANLRDLGERRDLEDEERNRKLEEEILQGRKERQARRAGRQTFSIAFSTTAIVMIAQLTKFYNNRARQINFSHKVFSCEYANHI